MKYEVNVKNKEAVSTRFSRVLRRGKLLGGQGGPGNQARVKLHKTSELNSLFINPTI